ncbi:MAG: ATP-binding protein [Synechococcales bacterium]|nr:ATP-binding protein [Synechococcales bacterium]
MSPPSNLSNLSSSLSVYDYLLQVGNTPKLTQVSPATFKALVASVIDVLIDAKYPAFLWAKLPKGESWRMELERCVSLAQASRTCYILRNPLDENSEDSSTSGDKLGDKDEDLQDGDRTFLGQDWRLSTSFQLQPESLLRREFFLWVWSPQFCGAWIAQRTKTKRLAPGELEHSETNDEAMERRTHLALTCTFDRSLFQGLIAHAAQLLQQEQTAVVKPDGSLDLRSLADLSEAWQQQLSQINPPAEFPAGLNLLFSKQIQRQEELWQRAATHRKQAELVDFLQLQNEELVGIVRAKDDFLSTVGQELRTPLTNMKTALTLLNSPNLKPPQRQRYMDLLVKECDRQSSLIGSLLDLVSLDQMAERQTLKPISVLEVVPAVVSTYQPLAEEQGVRLAYTVPEDLPPIASLNTWLRQIVVNILHNGIKFTPRGGQVWVRAKQQGDYIQIEIKDSGIGIPVQEIPKIFDRFYRVRQMNGEDYGGAGLGLTIVQQLLLRCGGSISVKSRPGEGSIFNVLLPVYQYRDNRND